MPQVEFSLSFEFEGYYLSRRDPPELRFSDPTEDLEIKLVHSEGTSAWVQDLCVTKTVLVSDNLFAEIQRAVSAAMERRLNDVHWEDLTHELRAKSQEINELLRNRASRFIELLRWHNRAAGPLEFLPPNNEVPGLYWKVDEGRTSYLIPQPRSQTVSIRSSQWQGIDQSSSETSGFSELWRREAREPLAHQLLREALEIYGSNPRATLLIAHSALEVGAKSHIKRNVPQAAWLLENLPSPPVAKIITKYLGELHAAEPVASDWSTRIKNAGFSANMLEEFSKARNALTHGGEFRGEKLQEWMDLTANLLYLFDFLDGYEWARDCMDARFAEAFQPYQRT